MKLLIPLGVAVLATACSNIERSRNLANPAVPAQTIAVQVCANCHGRDGNAVSPNFPSLAGQTREYLVAQLQQFRSHTRADKAAMQYMWGMTRSLTDEQIDGLAAYFAAQAPRARVMPAAAHATDNGGEIYRHGVPKKGIPACSLCHGDQAQGYILAPRLAHQYAEYTLRQLAVYQTGEERPDNGVMRAMLSGLTPEDLIDLARYLQDMPAVPPAATPETYARETSEDAPADPHLQ